MGLFTSKQEKKGVETKSVDSSLKEKFASIKNAETVPSTRIVRLRYKSCCGCGCNTIEIQREVAYDSSLKDGDYVKSLESNDRRV